RAYLQVRDDARSVLDAGNILPARCPTSLRRQRDPTTQPVLEQFQFASARTDTGADLVEPVVLGSEAVRSAWHGPPLSSVCPLSSTCHVKISLLKDILRYTAPDIASQEVTFRT